MAARLLLGKGYRALVMLLGCIALLALGTRTYAQDSTGLKRQKLGFMVGYGAQKLFPFNLPEYDKHIRYTYKAVMLQAQYYYSFTKKKSWGIEALVQPQFNLVSYRPVDTIAGEKNGIEFGVNAGVLVRRNLFGDLLSIYACLSSGPHYVSGAPARQVPGFIFSDNLFGGVNVKLHQDIFLDLRYGFRHISNAEIKTPNGGVDNVIANVGMFVRF